MDTNFEKMHKILAGLNNSMSDFVSSNGDDIKEVSIFNEDGSFNQELLTKEGFIQNIFAGEYAKIDLLDNDEEKKGDKDYLDSKYGKLYDAIANMDDNPEMSEEELKFIASFGKNSDKNTISKDDFYDLGIIGRDIRRYTEPNSKSEELRELLSKPEVNIVSPNKVEQPPEITAVNEELGINGRIEKPVIQGNVGDCWLLSGINALNATERGKEIIRNAIIPNDDGTVTINFAGVQKQITITPDEIREHDTDTNFQDMYSNGDNDALVLEIGMRKLVKENPTLFIGMDKDLTSGQTFNFWKAIIPNYNITHIEDKFEEPEITEADGRITQTSKSGPSDMYNNKVKELLQKALDNKNIAMEFSNLQHSMAITKVTENEVTYIDSMNYHETTLSWDEFVNLAEGGITYIDLSNN